MSAYRYNRSNTANVSVWSRLTSATSGNEHSKLLDKYIWTVYVFKKRQGHRRRHQVPLGHVCSVCNELGIECNPSVSTNVRPRSVFVSVEASSLWVAPLHLMTMKTLTTMVPRAASKELLCGCLLPPAIDASLDSLINPNQPHFFSLPHSSVILLFNS